MRNIVLIGMPGCGKSTVGVVLAKSLGMDFVDSDLVIQSTMGATLAQLIEQHGDDGFRDIENRVNASIDVQNSIIATGGGAVRRQRRLRCGSHGAPESHRYRRLPPPDVREHHRAAGRPPCPRRDD